MTFRDDLLDDFPELRAKWNPDDHPVIQILRTGVYVEPELRHDLRNEILFACECISDPWTPPHIRELLRRFAHEGTDLLHPGAG